MEHPEKQPPKDISINRTTNYLEIIYTRPNSLTFQLYTIFFLVWMIAFFRPHFVYPIAITLLGCVMFLVVYHSLCTVFNKIHLFLTPQKLIVRYKPFFQWGNKEIPLSHIKLITNQTQNSFDKERKGKEYLLFEIRAVKYGGQTEILFTTPSAEDAEYIQQKIMLYLAEL